jgi:hypothetical protein
MSQEHDNQPARRINYVSLGLAIGLVFGGAIGLVLDNIVFAGGGMVIGFAIGSALDKRGREDGP